MRRPKLLRTYGLQRLKGLRDGSLAGANWSAAVIFQKFLGFDGGHAAGSGGSDGLAIAAVLHIAAGVDAVNFREDVVVSFEITVGVSVELPGEHLGIGLVADAEEQRAGREIPDFAGLYVAQLQAGDFLFD